MPIYAYRCSTCGHAKDVLQKISDPVLTVCPECGAPTFVKQVTAAGFQLKGSGWYVTDFRDNKAKDAGKGKSGDAPAAETPASGDGAKAGEAKAGEASKGESSKGEASAAPAPAASPAPSPSPSSSSPSTPSGKTGS